MESNHIRLRVMTPIPTAPCYTQQTLVRTKGIKPLTPGWKPRTLSLRQARFIMVPPRGLEPRAYALQVRRSTN